MHLESLGSLRLLNTYSEAGGGQSCSALAVSDPGQTVRNCDRGGAVAVGAPEM